MFLARLNHLLWAAVLPAMLISLRVPASWPAMATGGLLDGTTRLSRNGNRVFHYSFLSTIAERFVVPDALRAFQDLAAWWRARRPRAAAASLNLELEGRATR